MSNEHARTENVRNGKGLRIKDKSPEAGFLARRLCTKPSLRGSVHFLTLRIGESCELIQRICIGFVPMDRIRVKLLT
jgi:hypothetical protein